MRKVMYTLIGVCLLSIIPLYRVINYYFFTPSQENVVVFVHGTIAVSLSIWNLKDIKNDAVSDDSKYVKAAKSFRDVPLMRHDQVMLDIGLEHISDDLIMRYAHNKLTPDEAKLGAYQLAGAYDLVTREVGHERNAYYAFGWDGLLSAQHRKFNGYKLYNQLCDELQKYATKPKVTIVAHSHGGNVALWLADAECELRRGLTIDRLVLLGCPIQQETAYLACSDVFVNIISFYSDADYVQTLDFASTEADSKPRIADYIKPELLNQPTTKITDVRLVVNGNRKQVDHTNMWLIGRSKKVMDCLEPLPVAALMPLLLKEVEKCPHLSLLDVHIDGSVKNQQLIASVHNFNSAYRLTESANVFDAVLFAQQLTKTSWCPDDRSTHPIFNAKSYYGMRAAFGI